MAMLKYWLWFSELGLHSQTRLALLQHFESPETVYFADEKEILLVDSMTREQAALLSRKDLSPAEKILEECQKQELHILTIQDAGYPARLKNIYDPPVLLYVKGTLPPMDEQVAVAVVGTRSCTPYGIQCAEKLGGQLASGGAIVVTGMARGIDSAAARGALRNGGTVIGVLGNGLDVVYPPENRYLYEDVAASGALITEYAPGTEPAGRHFPVRNRILSGLSVAALVVEAPERSGALITAETALEQGRDVYAVPGPIDSEASRGCNRLIRDGANLVADGWDLLRDYEGRFPGKVSEKQAKRPVVNLGYQKREEQKAPVKKLPELLDLSKEGAALTDDQLLVLKTLTEEPALVDDLVEQTQLPVRRVLSALTMLEIDHYVRQEPGGRYARNVTLTE